MTATTRTTECNPEAARVVSGIRIGQYEMDVGVYARAGAAAARAHDRRRRSARARAGGADRQGAVRGAARGPGAELL